MRDNPFDNFSLMSQSYNSLSNPYSPYFPHKSSLEDSRNEYKSKLRVRQNNVVNIKLKPAATKSSESSSLTSSDSNVGSKNEYMFPNKEKEVNEIIRECRKDVKKLEEQFFKEEYKDECIVLVIIRCYSL